MMRYLGFAACLLAYLALAANIFLQIMIGDCDLAGKAACEAARSNWLLALLGLSALVLAALVWAFFLRGRKRQGNS